MTRVRFEHIHASGRYSTTNLQLHTALEGYLAEPGVEVITGTEVGAERRESVIRAVAGEHGWASVTGDKSGMDDSMVMWNPAVFKAVAFGTEFVSTKTYPGKGGGRMAAAYVVLEAANGAGRLLVMCAHMPSSVESGGRWKAGARLRAWTANQRGYRNLWNRLAKTHNATGVLVCADWNVNIKRRFFRVVFRARQPGMTCTLNYGSMPKAGTLGNRLIDFAFKRGKVTIIKTPQIMPANSSSDHRPYRQTLELGA